MSRSSMHQASLAGHALTCFHTADELTSPLYEEGDICFDWVLQHASELVKQAPFLCSRP